MCLSLAACSNSILNAPASDSSSSNSSSTSNSAYNRTSGTATEQLLDEVVFPKDKIIDVKITMNEDDFQDMLNNASAEEYKPASVNYNGQQVDNIGIRTKGNLTLRSVVQMPDSDRYSFKLSFNEYVNQTLGGLEKINLNNNYSDASYMREYLAYELAESLGLPTPKYSFVNVYVNDELWGFYLAVEQIGTSYLERHFDNAYGALYKGVMTGSGSDLLWLDDDPKSYTGLELKSNSHNGNVLIDMLDELNHGTDYESVLFVDNALKYIALNVVTNNTDSYIGGNKQNYYLYEVDGVFSILPWDFNMAFGGLGGGGMGMGRGGAERNQLAGNAETGASIAPEAETRQDTSTGDETNQRADQVQRPSGTSLFIDEPTQGALAERPLIAKLLAVDAYKERYHSIIEEAIQGYLSEDKFSTRVEQLNQMIAAYVKQDPTAFYTYEEYQQGVAQLVAANARQVDNIAQQLDGTIPSSGDGSGSGGMGGGMRGGMGGNMGGRFDAGAAPDTSTHINTPTTAGEQGTGAQPGTTPLEAGQGAPSQQGAIPIQTEQEASNLQSVIPSQSEQEVPNLHGALPSQTEIEESLIQEEAPAWDNQPFVPDRPMPQGESEVRRRAPDGMGFGGRAGGFGPQNTQQQGSTSEAITAGISLLVLLAVSAFVLYFRRKRL
ncbi:spore coat protein CotH [Paenibacillus lentus]|uniref:Spore coat protein CotH n=2 Tax=Paenibacillus lentus TaxID=1338368 RepID=A0A3S8S217_9BACL|nr:spore coat protein CotH [Paenibacillus lentus]